MALATRDPVRNPSSCAQCGEIARLGEPCACVRGRPAPLSETPAAACADSQHYACPGYLLESAPGADVWLRCCCPCHASAEPEAAA
jgi:hypothetical protein